MDALIEEHQEGPDPMPLPEKFRRSRMNALSHASYSPIRNPVSGRNMKGVVGIRKMGGFWEGSGGFYKRDGQKGVLTDYTV